MKIECWKQALVTEFEITIFNPEDARNPTENLSTIW
jgi:hypothetical protein